ncbi:hypothetical protein HPB52_006157 [Rhipicephalus sanguineus]|uniref:Uncharacterized protein n=1 Tax=Rhipicephalus sanguineus TaxID=34632 RepID=A0A9D4T569_RHISA|nr:hypothetical protein HPB52_006157 [Rhipicephalus sanguineus]
MRLARSNVRLLVLIAFYFLFIVIGASIFSTIEAPHENSVIRKLRAKRAAFLEEHPCVKVSIRSCHVPYAAHDQCKFANVAQFITLLVT